MPKYVAFLRAINVGGRRVKMDELRGIFEDFGLGSVETFIASGNVIFDAGAEARGALVRRVEEHLAERLGYPVATFLRTPEEIAAIALAQPFSPSEMALAQAFSVGFLAEPLSAEGRRRLEEIRTDIDRFCAHGSEVYWLCEKKQSESKFSNVAFERCPVRDSDTGGPGVG